MQRAPEIAFTRGLNESSKLKVQNSEIWLPELSKE